MKKKINSKNEFGKKKQNETDDNRCTEIKPYETFLQYMGKHSHAYAYVWIVIRYGSKENDRE